MPQIKKCAQSHKLLLCINGYCCIVTNRKYNTEKRATILGNMVSKQQLAELLQVSENTVDRMRKRGMPWQRVGVKLTRYDVDKVNAWLEQQQQPAENS